LTIFNTVFGILSILANRLYVSSSSGGSGVWRRPRRPASARHGSVLATVWRSCSTSVCPTTASSSSRCRRTSNSSNGRAHLQQFTGSSSDQPPLPMIQLQRFPWPPPLATLILGQCPAHRIYRSLLRTYWVSSADAAARPPTVDTNITWSPSATGRKQKKR